MIVQGEDAIDAMTKVATAVVRELVFVPPSVVESLTVLIVRVETLRMGSQNGINGLVNLVTAIVAHLAFVSPSIVESLTGYIDACGDLSDESKQIAHHIIQAAATNAQMQEKRLAGGMKPTLVKTVEKKSDGS